MTGLIIITMATSWNGAERESEWPLVECGDRSIL